MSEDRRELILKRLIEIAKTIDGIVEVTRNDPSLDDVSLPAIALFDGPEVPASFASDEIRPGRMPLIMDMSPQLSVVLQDNSEDSGASLSIYRARVVKAVLYDETLAQLAGNGGRRTHGNVRYRGLTPDVIEGRLIVGRINLHFDIAYVLDSAAL